jgi:hypothetical protein
LVATPVHVCPDNSALKVWLESKLAHKTAVKVSPRLARGQ